MSCRASVSRLSGITDVCEKMFISCQQLFLSAFLVIHRLLHNAAE